MALNCRPSKPGRDVTAERRLEGGVCNDQPASDSYNEFFRLAMIPSSRILVAAEINSPGLASTVWDKRTKSTELVGSAKASTSSSRLV